MPPKKSSIVLNVEQFIHDIEERPAIWNRNFHCNKAFLEQMWDELSTEHKLPKVVLKAKWKGLRDNFRVEYKRIPRGENGDFLVEPATFESKWTHYYALLFLTDHMRHRNPKNNISEDGQPPGYYFPQTGDECERTIVEPDLTNGLVRRLNDSDEEFDEDDVDEDDEAAAAAAAASADDAEENDFVSLLQQRQQATMTPPAAHANSYASNLAIKTEDARALLKLSGVAAAAVGLTSLDCSDSRHSNNSNSGIEKEAQDLSKKSMSLATTTATVSNNSNNALTSQANITSNSSTTIENVARALVGASAASIAQQLQAAVNFTRTSSASRSTSPVINSAAAATAILQQIPASNSSTILSPSAATTLANVAAPSLLTPIKAVSQQHKKRSVSPPPLYNKAHHPLASTLLALSNKEREDYTLNGSSTNCHLHVGSIQSNNVEHLNFTKHSYANGLIPALKLKRPRLSEDSQFNGSSTMDTNTSVSNASTTPSPLQSANSNSLVQAVPEDDDYHYLLSLHPYMKQMNAAQKLRIRTKFQKLIFKELYKEDLEESK